MIVKFVKEENIEEVVIGNVVIMILLYADDAIFFANIIGDAQILMSALEEFFMYIKLRVNSSKKILRL